MVAQQSLFNTEVYVIANSPKQPKKRVRYKTPTYRKTYSFYHINPYTNEIEYNGDERHIFRVKDLHKVYSLLYFYGEIPLFETKECIFKNGLIFYPEDKQAELENTWNLPIKERLLKHIKLLKQLRKGLNLEEAINGQR